MKKSLLLIALLVISVSAFAAAPTFSDIPDVKLLLGEGLTPAFDLECFNTGDVATSYSVTAAFEGLSTLAGSSVIQGPYFGGATVGGNTYAASNEGGTNSVSNSVKWSTYRINKLPTVGLTVGNSVKINVGAYASGNPESFGNAAAIEVSDPAVTATWDNADIITISLVSAISGPAYVDVIASPVATPSVGYDQDKERIAVYQNLITGATFDTAADTTTFGPEGNAPISWAASQTDGNGEVANGVMVITLANNTFSYKGTNLAGAIPYSAGQWYTSRMRYAAAGTGVGSSQAQIWNFSNPVATLHVDLAANIVFGANTAWNWLEIPMYSNAVGTGYAQMQFKGTATGSVTFYVDEVQIINAAPSIIRVARGCDTLGFAAGDFDSAADTTGWGVEPYNAGNPTIASTAIAGGKISFTFTAAGTSGVKYTAKSGTAIYTPQVDVGEDVGAKANVDFTSGSFTNAAGIFVLYVYGVTADGGTAFFTGGQLIGAAEFFGVTDGDHYTVAPAKNQYYQFQFAAKGNQAATVAVDDVDFLEDNDNPYFGEASLFP